MKDLPEFYGNQIQIIKDVLAGSRFAVASQWTGVSVEDAQRALMQDAGVLFADAGRSRNPYNRTEAEQNNIAEFTHDMLKKYLAVRATVKTAQWAPLMQELQCKAKLVQKAALWAMQSEFMADPVFVGPIVAADIIAAGLKSAEARFSRVAQALADGNDDFQFGEFSWGAEVQSFVTWAKTVRLCPRPKLCTKLQSATDDEGSSASIKAARESGCTEWREVRKKDHFLIDTGKSKTL